MEILTNNAFLIYAVFTAIALVYLIRKVSKPITVTRTPKPEDELDLRGIGQSILKFKPMILKQFIKKSEKETDVNFKSREQTVSDFLDGIAELFSSDAINEAIKIIKKVFK